MKCQRTVYSASLVITMAFFAACNQAKDDETVTNKTTEKRVELELKITPINLSGTDNKPTVGQRVKVHYTGWLFDETADENKGKQFDSSRDRGTPFVFTFGVGQVIKGWDDGLQKMNIGDRVYLTIPSELAYGANGIPGVIPKHAVLLFDVELIDIIK